MVDAPPFMIGMAATELVQSPAMFRDVFARRRSILCRNAIAPQFLAKLQALCEQGRFVTDHVPELGDREVEQPQRAGGAITLALQRSGFLRWVEAATDCGPLATVAGRVVQARANNHDQLDWHDDRSDPARRMAITVNLAAVPYVGGLFELRHVKTRTVLATHHHAEPGTVMIFDVAPDLEHRVLPVSSGGPRRMYTGWFMKGAS